MSCSSFNTPGPKSSCRLSEWGHSLQRDVEKEAYLKECATKSVSPRRESGPVCSLVDKPGLLHLAWFYGSSPTMWFASELLILVQFPPLHGCWLAVVEVIPWAGMISEDTTPRILILWYVRTLNHSYTFVITPRVKASHKMMLLSLEMVIVD